MEHTELVDKYVSGEIDDAVFNAEFDKLDEPTKKIVTDSLKEAKPKIISEISAIRKERDRVKEQKVEAEKPPEDFIKKFRGEQVEKAMKRFFDEKGVDETEQAIIRANFAKLDDGAIDAELIGENMKRVYAYSFPDKIFQDTSGEEGAARMTNRNAGSANKGGEPSQMKDDDPRVQQIIAAGRREGIDITPEAAKKELARGRGSWHRLPPLPSK